MTIHRILSVLISLFTTIAVADDSHDDHGHDGHHEHHDDHAEHKPTILIPEALPDLWAHLNAYHQAVVDASEVGDMEILHKEQINLEALIEELSHTVDELDSSKRKQVEGVIANASHAMEQLHDATIAEDLSGTQKASKALTGVLTLLKAQYPKEVTGGMAEVKDDLGPHKGMLASFQDAVGNTAGYLELKLHDDTGDLELWLGQDPNVQFPFDLPADSIITVDFEAGKDTSVRLKVRNLKFNQDSEGHPTMRNGMTNYFIFPGDTGADASWLTEANSKAMVTVRFSASGEDFATKPFLLVSHGHEDHGHEDHGHEDHGHEDHGHEDHGHEH